jgi:hypothetical protein
MRVSIYFAIADILMVKCIVCATDKATVSLQLELRRVTQSVPHFLQNHIVACGSIARQQPQIKQPYNSRC